MPCHGWRFPEIGVPPVIIHLNEIFPNKNPFSWGNPITPWLWKALCRIPTQEPQKSLGEIQDFHDFFDVWRLRMYPESASSRAQPMKTSLSFACLMKPF